MNSVAFSRRPRARRRSASRAVDRRLPDRAAVRLDGRPRPVGRKGAGGRRVASWSFQYAICSSSAPSREARPLPRGEVAVLERQSAASGAVPPCVERFVKRARAPGTARRPTSRRTTMWCMASRSTCSASLKRSRPARNSGPAREVERAAGVLRREAHGFGVRPPACAARSTSGSSTPARLGNDLHRLTAVQVERGRAAFRGGATISVRLRCSASTSSGPVSHSEADMLYALPEPSWLMKYARSCANESGAGPGVGGWE